MYKIIILALTMTITACGGSDSSTSNEESNNSVSGIFEGTITATGDTPDSAVALITSNGKVAIVDIDTIEGFMGTINGSSLTGTIYSSSSVPATGEITNVSGDNISGTYTSSLGGGTFSLVSNTNLYNRTSALSKLTGTWVDETFTNGTGVSTWVIQSNGQFSVSTTLGCNGTGAFSIIDSSKNEYSANITITNCLGLNGSYSGIGALSDTFNNDDTISFLFNNGSVGGISEMIKQ